MKNFSQVKVGDLLRYTTDNGTLKQYDYILLESWPTTIQTTSSRIWALWSIKDKKVIKDYECSKFTFEESWEVLNETQIHETV